MSVVYCFSRDFYPGFFMVSILVATWLRLIRPLLDCRQLQTHRRRPLKRCGFYAEGVLACGFFPAASGAPFLRDSVGDTPTRRLKKRWKADLQLKPDCSNTSSTVISACFSSLSRRLASSTR